MRPKELRRSGFGITPFGGIARIRFKEYDLSLSAPLCLVDSNMIARLKKMSINL